MKTATIVARVLLGLLFVVFGLNYFFPFMPNPDLPPRAADFFTALFATGYMLPMIKGVEVVCGAMLVTGFFAPLALVLLAPGIVNIVMFHTFLARGGLPIALAILAVELFLMVRYRRYYSGVFTMKAAD